MPDVQHGRFTVEPIEGHAHEGRQIGWVVKHDGIPVINVHTGGTGECWNISETGPEPQSLHTCDLDELIAALEALRDSEAHRMHVERWS